MSLRDTLWYEIRAVGIAALYFGAWLAMLLAIKQLIPAEYEIYFYGMSKVLLGALILSKVVIVLDHVSLGEWVRRRPAWISVVLRMLLCALGVLVVLLLEKGFEGRGEHGGFGAALQAAFAATDIYHVWVNTIDITGALLVYNLLAVLQAPRRVRGDRDTRHAAAGGRTAGADLGRLILTGYMIAGRLAANPRHGFGKYPVSAYWPVFSFRRRFERIALEPRQILPCDSRVG